jgi:hypothetical protein
MPPANRDASELTRRLNAMSLNSWKTQLDAANTNASIVRREQPSTQVLTVVTQRNTGGCYCGRDNAGMTDSRNTCGACRGTG